VYIYVNGVLQQPSVIVTGLNAEVSGLQLDTDYVFAVVGIAAGQPASTLSNSIPYRHASTAEFETVTKYAWGDTPQQGYIIRVKLFTPE
jgi:hypothetical protein